MSAPSVEVASTATASPARALLARSAQFLAEGNPRPVLRAACQSDPSGVLALVLETDGSTYAHAGGMAYFSTHQQVGWLSGGCLEPALAQHAAACADRGRLGWMEIDTRGDEYLFSGSALGCRGRLRVALVPLAVLGGATSMFEGWLGGTHALHLTLNAEGQVRICAGAASIECELAHDPLPWQAAGPGWTFTLLRSPAALVLGAGPEAPMLLQLLHDLGWHTTLVERRPRWQCPAAPVDRRMESIDAALHWHPDVALVMHHQFELDRDSLAALSCNPPAFIGLLGPRRRFEDLCKLLGPLQRSAIMPTLHTPVGLPLGGQGPEAIALSIAAQLQAWRTAASFQ